MIYPGAEARWQSVLAALEPESAAQYLTAVEQMRTGHHTGLPGVQV